MEEQSKFWWIQPSLDSTTFLRSFSLLPVVAVEDDSIDLPPDLSFLTARRIYAQRFATPYLMQPLAQ